MEKDNCILVRTELFLKANHAEWYETAVPKVDLEGELGNVDHGVFRMR